jgi:hypothetical protein
MEFLFFLSVCVGSIKNFLIKWMHNDGRVERTEPRKAFFNLKFEPNTHRIRQSWSKKNYAKSNIHKNLW